MAKKRFFIRRENNRSSITYVYDRDHVFIGTTTVNQSGKVIYSFSLRNYIKANQLQCA